MPLDDFLNPSDENDAGEPDLSDMILHLPGGGDGGDGVCKCRPAHAMYVLPCLPAKG
jgi:hypothetical protein